MEKMFHLSFKMLQKVLATEKQRKVALLKFASAKILQIFFANLKLIDALTWTPTFSFQTIFSRQSFFINVFANLDILTWNVYHYLYREMWVWTLKSGSNSMNVNVYEQKTWSIEVAEFQAFVTILNLTQWIV